MERSIEAPPSHGPDGRVVVAPPSQIFPTIPDTYNGNETTIDAAAIDVPELDTPTTKRKHRATKPTPTHILIAGRVRLLMRTPDGKSLVQFEDGTTELFTDPLIPIDIVKQYL
jgi:hypothetical protein